MCNGRLMLQVDDQGEASVVYQRVRDDDDAVSKPVTDIAVAATGEKGGA